MQKMMAILVSVLYYIGAFMLLFHFSLGNDIRWFILGFPLLAAIYFIVAGNIFSYRLHLNRWYLWVSMNFVGGLCSWLILLVCFPTLLWNGFILILMIPFVCVFSIIWVLIGLVFLYIKWRKNQSHSAS